jgi:protein gp37
MAQWNPWHGCSKISPGCQNCYVYRIDSAFEKDSSRVTKTANFDLPLKKRRNGDYKIEPGQMVYTCFSSDFFLDRADDWRIEAWRMIRHRKDLHFFIITKRIDRFSVNLPDDWGEGYDHVTICSTCENQDRANYRLPILRSLPIRHKLITCEPLLERVDLSPWLDHTIEEVIVGGESGDQARVCDYNWVLDIRSQCMQKNVPFHFKQTGAKFLKNGRIYQIKRQYQHQQAAKAGIDFHGR